MSTLMLKAALDTLFAVLFTMVRVMAPFTPFLTEMMYQQLRKKAPQFAGAESNSVHYLMLPVARADLIHEDIERAVGRMQAVVDLGRVLRDRKTMPVRNFPSFRKITQLLPGTDTLLAQSKLPKLKIHNHLLRILSISKKF